jgi:bifunctional non-homologous end joining protein LigD
MTRPTSLPARLRPALATLVDAAPPGDGWIHEVKYDGYRLICVADGRRVRLWTRTGQDWTTRFPTIARAIESLDIEAVLDGEGVVLRPDGLTSFQDLQNALRGVKTGTLCCYVFDLLSLSGRDLRDLPLLERKARLADLIADTDDTAVIRYSDHVVGDGPRFYRQACAHGLEGIMSKRAAAPYRAGRGRDWLKVKCVLEQEFVIGGFTEPSGSRGGLGALLVGAYAAEGLKFAGKVGTGFTARVLDELRGRLVRLERRTPPFVDPPRGAAARGVHWTAPELVAEVHFTAWTDDGRLRHPSFKGLREDKKATEVRIERPVPVNGTVSSREENAGVRRRPEALVIPRPSADARRRARTSRRRRSGARTGRGVGGAKRSVARGAAAERRPGRTKDDAMEYEGVVLSSTDRVLYAESGFTKVDLAEHYVAAADRMLPHLENRPLTLVRCPRGRGRCFYQKHFEEGVPEGIAAVEIEERDGPASYGVVRSLAGVIALVQMGVLEIHTWGCRADRLERPDRITIDLDPDPTVPWSRVVEAARAVRLVLEEVGLTSFIKATGGKGLHVVSPIQRRTDWEEAKAFTRAVCEVVARASPGEYTLDVSKRKRRGRILLDYLRNAQGATAVEVYSTRARAGAPVALPVRWDELDGIEPDAFRLGELAERLAAPDPWADYFALRQGITAAARRRLARAG